MYLNKQELLTILPELKIIEGDTGLRINRVKELRMILDIYERQIEEYTRLKPGDLKIEKKNRLSLYLTMNCYNRLNKSN